MLGARVTGLRRCESWTRREDANLAAREVTAERRSCHRAALGPAILLHSLTADGASGRVPALD
jgi:hypothetical protein